MTKCLIQGVTGWAVSIDPFVCLADYFNDLDRHGFGSEFPGTCYPALEASAILKAMVVAAN